MTIKIFKDLEIKKYYYPFLFQAIIFNAMYFIDASMIGVLAEESISAISLSAQFLWIIQCIIWSFPTVMGLLVSRYWGRKRVDKIYSLITTNIILIILISIVVSLGIFTFIHHITGFYTAIPQIQREMSIYLRIVSIGLFISGINLVYEMYYHNTERSNIALKLYIVEVVVNIILNTIFIYEWILGLGLNILGAGLATTLAKTIKLAIYLYITQLKYNKPTMKNVVLAKRVVKKSLPLILETLFWNLSLTLIIAKVGKLTPVEVFVYSIFMSTLYLLFSPIEAFSNAVNVKLGILFGRNERDSVYDTSNRLINLGYIIQLGLILITWIFFYNIDFFFRSVSQSTLLYTRELIPYILVYLVIKSQSHIYLNGFLKVGFDNIFKIYLESALIVITIIYLRYFTRDLTSIFILLVLLDSIRLLISKYRYNTKKWLLTKPL